MIFLITPPFTQLNTPYPATAYLKGFLNTRGIISRQADLGIDVILAIFNRQGLSNLFAHIDQHPPAQISPNSRRILALRRHYINTIDAVIVFLQGKNPTLAFAICQPEFLPRAKRFEQLDEDLSWAFGSMGIQDQAKHLATLYLEDISDLISDCVDEHFGFSRYAERLGRSANSFDALYAQLQQPPTYTDRVLFDVLAAKVADIQPRLVCISVPFPGNLYGAFRCAQWLRLHQPQTKIAMGGGFPNTELRSISDARVFEFFDFITLDDGEAPVEHLWEHINGNRPPELLKRAFCLLDGKVEYINNSLHRDYKFAETGCPDYSDLPLQHYISAIEVANPMHRLWSDGRWNKLTMAHGCYWGKCTFCDISLDYIKVYEPVAAATLCDRMEQLIAQTGQTGFHFVDEAAPPALMRALALEILRRGLVVSWWTNIRFEKSFSRDLCQLLRASGCIAVSGGLEVASNRLLELIQKGVTVEQVAQVCRNFTEADIMVHAYLMYGFPTQTTQETVDSLEMVRQMFEQGVLQSGFWHLFAMTAHSPVGMNPEAFKVQCTSNQQGSFANNDLTFTDKKGTDHEAFSFGLRKSLINFMHGYGFDLPLQNWFDFKIPRTKVDPDFISNALDDEMQNHFLKATHKLVWIGEKAHVHINEKKKTALVVTGKTDSLALVLPQPQAQWLADILDKISVLGGKMMTFQELKNDYEQQQLPDFELFWYNGVYHNLRSFGLLAF